MMIGRVTIATPITLDVRACAVHVMPSEMIKEWYTLYIQENNPKNSFEPFVPLVSHIFPLHNFHRYVVCSIDIIKCFIVCTHVLICEYAIP
jgi:hypothetical protein